jgi:23S rRNA pseudouridine1911/1915/1917 synthase
MTGARILTLVVTAEMAGRTVGSLLERELGLAAGRVRSLKWRDGSIARNGARARTVDRVAVGDVITVDVGDPPGRGGVFAPADLPLRVLYEDEDLLVVDKPAGLAMHDRRAGADDAPSLGAAVVRHLGAGAVFHPVSRLDRGTSGVVCVARSGHVHELLRRRLHTEDYRREYLAVVVGVPSPPAGTVTWPIGPATGGPRWDGLRCEVRADGRPAHTAYETLATGDGLSLLRVTLGTGRTHQIRVHLAALDCPLLGDASYGAPDARIARPALHAAVLRLAHPITGAGLVISAPPPPDLMAVCPGLVLPVG